MRCILWLLSYKLGVAVPILALPGPHRNYHMLFFLIFPLFRMLTPCGAPSHRKSVDVLIASYERIAAFSADGQHMPIVDAIPWSVVIIDECHSRRNVKGKYRKVTTNLFYCGITALVNLSLP